MAMTTPFVWQGNRAISATEAERNRKTAEALANRIRNPQNMWEGIQSATGDIGGALLNWQSDQAEEAGRSEVAKALEAAQAGGNPNDFISVLGNEWASPSQSAVASALLNRQWSAQDRETEWAREDARASVPKFDTFESGGDLYRYDINDPNAEPSVFFDGPDQAAGFRPLSAEEKAAYGLPPDSAAQMGPDGKVDLLGGSGQTINVNTGNDNALDKKLSEKEGESWAAIKDAGMVSGAMGQDLAVLDELMTVAPQGPITGRLADTFKGFNSAGDAFKSIVKRIAPSLRAPGSGATSDIEYQGFLDSLPSLANSPEANMAINSIMKAKAALNVERANIIAAYQAGSIDVTAARAQIARLNSTSIITPEMKKALLGVGVENAGAAPAPPQVGEVVDGFTYLGGDPASPTSWRQ